MGEALTGKMASARNMINCLLIFLAITLLYLMYTEQEKVQRCTEYIPASVSGKTKLVYVLKNSSGEWDHNWDKKYSEGAAQNAPTRTLILVRHGQYDFKTGHLTELGMRQANLTGMRLKSMGYEYTEVIHSTLVRAVQTAQQIHAYLPNIPLSSDDFIREGGPVPPKPTITYWGLPARDYYVDGPRLEAAFRKYFYRADADQPIRTRQLLVGHGNIFRFFVLRALQFPKEAWMRVFIAHASITVLHIHGDGTVSMDKFGDSGHLPPDMVTY